MWQGISSNIDTQPNKVLPDPKQLRMPDSKLTCHGEHSEQEESGGLLGSHCSVSVTLQLMTLLSCQQYEAMRLRSQHILALI